MRLEISDQIDPLPTALRRQAKRLANDIGVAKLLHGERAVGMA